MFDSSSQIWRDRMSSKGRGALSPSPGATTPGGRVGSGRLRKEASHAEAALTPRRPVPPLRGSYCVDEAGNRSVRVRVLGERIGMALQRAAEVSGLDRTLIERLEAEPTVEDPVDQ